MMTVTALALSLATTVLSALLAGPASGQGTTPLPRVHLVYMADKDCRSCADWVRLELPWLRATPVFKAIEFSQMPKPLEFSVPPRWLLPEAVKPFKAQLDDAGNGLAGSPQVFLLVNGEVFDSWCGRKSAGEIEARLTAARHATPYPGTPRKRLTGRRGVCEGTS